MRIEPATMADLDRVVEAWVDLACGQRRHGSHIRGSANRDVMRQLLAQHVVDGSLLVARNDGFCGFINFAIERGGFERSVSRGVIRNLYVAPDARNGGVGTALLDAAEDALEAAGVEVLVLEAMAANEDVRRLYRRRGYRPHRVEFERQVESTRRSNHDGGA